MKYKKCTNIQVQSDFEMNFFSEESAAVAPDICVLKLIDVDVEASTRKKNEYQTIIRKFFNNFIHNYLY